ncbi:MAG: amidohydrolase [Candidatus Bathyarchaeia archaeon]
MPKPSPPSSILLKGCSWIITQNTSREIIRGGSILVRDGLIEKVSERPIKAGNVDLVVDGKGKLALPGLINAHTHASMTLFRGYADDMHLKEWLEEKIWPLEKKLTGDLCYLGALLGCIEMIKTGTTCFLDMYFHPDHVAKAAGEAGIRAYVSHALIDLMDRDEGMRQMGLAEEYIRKIRDIKDPRIGIAISPHAPYSCSEETLLKAKEAAEREGIPLHIHLAETRREQVDFERNHGLREVEYLDKIGFLSPRLVAAHSVWLTRREIRLLAERGVKVAHCPVSNMKLAEGGTAPIPEMMEDGVTVSLGTDGAASNNCLDMFETMKICALAHKAHRWDPTVAPAQAVLDMATIGGAAALGLSHEIGSISEGMRGDIILIDLSSPNLRPIHAPSTLVSHMVYSAKGCNVDTVIVDGRILMHRRRLKTLDEAAVYSAVDSAVSSLIGGTA